MKIEKLPSGSYRLRKTYKKKLYTVVVKYKPTQKEAIQLMAEQLDAYEKTTTRVSFDFETAANEYISSKSNVLSPSTVNSYKGILRNLSEEFKKILLNDVTDLEVQREINSYSIGRAPKTVRNAHGFISAVLGMYRPKLSLSTTLPQKRKVKKYLPTDDDVSRILHYAKGKKYELVMYLAVFGLRRSEMCALTKSDLDGNILTISKAKVVNEDGDYVIKDNTKTPDGTRSIYVPDSIVEMIKNCKGDEIYAGCPDVILTNLHRYQDALGIPRFRLHDLRHYYASMAHALGIPDAYIMQSGGWKSDAVLKGIYRHAMDDKKNEMQQFAAEYITELSS